MTKRKVYKKPLTRIYKMLADCPLLSGSGEPKANVTVGNWSNSYEDYNNDEYEEN